MENGLCHFSQYSVAPGRNEEAEKLFKAWASRMKGSPGFVSCSVLRALGEHGSHDYALLQQWESNDDARAFLEKNREFNPTLGAPSHHHHDEEDDEEGEQKELFHEEFHGHFEVIFKV